MKQLTKQLLIFLAMCGVITARAADGDTFTAKSTEGIEMTFKVISESDKTCQVGDNRNCCLADKTIEGTLTIPETANGYRVTKIGDNAFDVCENIKSFNLPASIVLIGEYAFRGCKALEELTLPQNVETIDNGAFKSSGLKSFIWNSAIRTLGSQVFLGCPFTEMTLPGCITELGEGIFWNCEDLTSVTLNEGITEVPRNFFYYCGKLTTVNLPTTVTSIGWNAFTDAESLTELVVPEGCTEIGSAAFLRSGLKKIWLPSTMKKIDKSFQDTGLEEVVLAEGLTSIAGFFTNASNLKRIHLPASVVNITNAFNGCGKIEELSIDPNNSVFDSRDNCNGIVETATNTLVRGCATTTIPATVTAIGASAFNGVKGIKELVVPQQVKSIGENAFASSSFNRITLHDELESLGEGAFSGSSIKEFTLPKSIDEVPDKLFYECKYLEKVTLHDKTIGIRRMAFNSTSALTTMDLPTSLTYLAGGVFGNSGLEYLTVPGNVIEIGSNCFGECRKLKHVVIEGNPKLVIRERAFYKTWIEHLSFLTNSLALNGCGREAFYPDMITYQAYYDEAIHNSFETSSNPVFDSFIGIISGQEWTPILCSNKNYELPDGLEAYIVTGVVDDKAQLLQVESINKGQPVLLRLKDATKASEVITMTNGDLLRFDTKELDDSEVKLYGGGEDYNVAVGFTNIYSENKGKVVFLYENGTFVRKQDAELVDVNGINAYIALDPEVAGDRTTISVGEAVTYEKGDADGNGIVDATDAAYIAKIILNGKYVTLADVNKDGKVDAADIVALVKLLLGK